MAVPRPSFVRPLFVTCLAVACLGGGYALGLRDVGHLGPAGPAQVSATDQRAFGVLWETLSTLERDYYRPDQLDPTRLADAAVRGMVAAVGDPYSSLSDAQQAELTAAELPSGYLTTGSAHG